MLPLEKPWYRRLLLFTLVIGVAGGVLSLAFSTVTGAGIHFFFGNVGAGWWDGKWWWIPFMTIGGFTVSVLRKIWKVPSKVPSPIKLAHDAWVEPGVQFPGQSYQPFLLFSERLWVLFWFHCHGGRARLLASDLPGKG
jgi:hypothetical protein